MPQNLIKIAQRWQQVFPFEKLDPYQHPKEERIVSYEGNIKGQPYWGCSECGQPILDDDGNPINQKELIAGFNRTTIPQEKTLDYKFDEGELNKILNYAKEYFLKAAKVVKEDDIKSHEFKHDLSRLSQEFISNVEDILRKIEATLIDKGVKKYEDIKIIYDLSINYQQLDTIYYSTISSYQVRADYIVTPDDDEVVEVESVEKKIEKLKAKLLEELNKRYQSLPKVENFLRQFINASEVTRVETPLLKPICHGCYYSLAWFCDEPGCNFSTLDEDDIFEIEKWERKERNVMGKMVSERVKEYLYYCEDHAEKCDHCGKGVHHKEVISKNNYNFHDECYYEIYSACDECGEEEYREDLLYIEDTGQELCRSCHESYEEGIEGEVSDDALSEARTLFDEKEKFYPLDENTISRSIIPIINAAIKNRDKKSSSYDSSIEFIVTRLPKIEQKAAVQAEAQYHSDLEGLLNFFLENIEELKEVKATYPNLKGFKLFPVKIVVAKGATGHGGNVFAIYPSDKFLDWAELMMPGAKEAYNKVLKNRGHHRGALGYARFSLSNDNVIIDNLQTDLDTQALGDDDPVVSWWTSQIKKMWAPTLLDALNQFGNKIEKSVYLTNFEMQRKKWHSIPERNIDVYERIPKMMDMEEEEVEAKPEDLNRGTWTMRRVANILYNAVELLYKRATNEELNLEVLSYEELEKLVKHTDDQSLLEKLYEQNYDYVQAIVAKKTKSSELLNEIALNNDNPNVLGAAISNPNMTKDSLLIIKDRNIDNYINDFVEKQLSNYNLRFIIDPNLPAEFRLKEQPGRRKSKSPYR